MKTRVYFNLHKKRWSVQLKNAKGNWYVAFHANVVSLSGVTFRVSEAGRQRVIRTHRKNVHAFACGELAGMWGASVVKDIRNVPVMEELSKASEPNRLCWDRLTYNPFKYEGFVVADATNVLVKMSPAVFLEKTFDGPKVWAKC